MYRGFNLDVGTCDFSKWYDVGKEAHEKNKMKVSQLIDSFKDENGNLVASKIIAGWFPPIEAQIFLSHSHRDEEQVIGLSGWLSEKFGLIAFVDSCIWGCSDKLLKLIDREYCYNKSGDYYSYEKRNRSTAHVYMMLSVALAKMINSCECIFFVNTPQSISPKKYIKDDDITLSPWIYSEISMTGLVNKRTPADHRKAYIRMDAAIEESKSLPINYTLDVKHLTLINNNHLKSWADSNSFGVDALDFLYRSTEHKPRWLREKNANRPESDIGFIWP